VDAGRRLSLGRPSAGPEGRHDDAGRSSVSLADTLYERWLYERWLYERWLYERWLYERWLYERC
jgi:hypothetical protein